MKRGEGRVGRRERRIVGEASPRLQQGFELDSEVERTGQSGAKAGQRCSEHQKW
jgi:hypothetical protein